MACSFSRRAPSSGSILRPSWPLPKIFRLTKGGKLNEGVFKGETINTPSLLCVEDYLDALNWANPSAASTRSSPAPTRTLRTVANWVETPPAFDFLAKTPATPLQHERLPEIRRPEISRSRRRRTGDRQEPRVACRKEGAGYDFGAYRDAPPGLRIWCGATVEAADVAVLTPWIDWAFAEQAARRRTDPISSQGKDLLSVRPCTSVLISDQLSAAAAHIFTMRGVQADFQPTLGKDQTSSPRLSASYDGLAIRSATKVTADILAKRRASKGYRPRRHRRRQCRCRRRRPRAASS